jgi:hypothetical protein
MKKKRRLHLLKKGSTNITEFADLDTVAGCRKFLSDIRFDGKPMTHCWQGEKRLAFADLSDEEVLAVANQLYWDFFGDKK